MVGICMSPFLATVFFEGCDSSAKYNRLPQVPMFPQLLEYGLEAEYGGG